MYFSTSIFVSVEGDLKLYRIPAKITLATITLGTIIADPADPCPFLAYLALDKTQSFQAPAFALQSEKPAVWRVVSTD
jgi:hypothetical protein